MSKKQKLTPWFPGDVKPVRRGEYEVRRIGILLPYPAQTKLIWDGERWRHTAQSSCGQFVLACARMSSDDKWRGLAVKHD